MTIPETCRYIAKAARDSAEKARNDPRLSKEDAEIIAKYYEREAERLETVR